jgi:D-amino-acid dehydrogenase
VHVAVCGAGVIGLSCAIFLAERGHDVTVVDREAPQRDGCSFGNSGLIVPSHFEPLASPGRLRRAFRWMFDSASPFYVRPRLDAAFLGWALRFMRAANARHVARSAPVMRDLLLESRTLYGDLARRTDNAIGLVTRGLIVLCSTRRGLEEESRGAAHANALRIPAEVVSPSQAAQLDSGIRMHIAGGVFYPLDSHLSPPRLMAVLLQLAEGAGVRFEWSTQVTGWRTSARKIDAVQTSRGEIAADAFVLAGGSWSPHIVKSLGIRLPLQPGKGYSITLQHPRRVPQLSSVLSEAAVAVTPMGSALRFGGTMELSGFDGPFRSERVASIVRAATQVFPELRPEDFGAAPAWSGLRPCTPDGLPYVGRFARYPNLCAATGHAMMGVSLAPVTGKLVAQMLSGEEPTLPVAALDPDRYG